MPGRKRPLIRPQGPFSKLFKIWWYTRIVDLCGLKAAKVGLGRGEGRKGTDNDCLLRLLLLLLVRKRRGWRLIFVFHFKVGRSSELSQRGLLFQRGLKRKFVGKDARIPNFL